MKHLKILGLAAIAAAALMALVSASSASATTLTCTEPFGTKVTCRTGTTFKAASEGHAVLDSSVLGNVECNSTAEGPTSNEGNGTETVKGGGSSAGGITFTNCTSAVVAVLASGTLELHTEGTSANNNGTLTSTGAEVTVEKFGFHCIFSTNATDIGKVTGSTTTKGKATVDVTATVPRAGGRSGAFCGSSSPWTGSYVVNSPEWLDVD